MRSKYNDQTNCRTFFDEVDTAFSGQNATGDNSTTLRCYRWYGYNRTRRNQPRSAEPTATATETDYNVGQGMRTDDAESLGTSGNEFNEMAFSIEKVTVTAKSRDLKAEYSLELAQDLKAIHGLNAEAELANILPQRFLLKSTVKSSEPSTRLLSKVLLQTLLLQVSSTWTLIPTVAGV